MTPNPTLVTKVAAAIAKVDDTPTPVTYDVLASAAIEAVVAFILGDPK